LLARVGRVRCGVCLQAFNAQDDLLDIPAEIHTSGVEVSENALSFPSIHPEMALESAPLVPLKAPPAPAQTASVEASPVETAPAQAAPAPVEVAPTKTAPGETAAAKASPATEAAPAPPPPLAAPVEPQLPAFDNPNSLFAPDPIIDPVDPAVESVAPVDAPPTQEDTLSILQDCVVRKTPGQDSTARDSTEIPADSEGLAHPLETRPTYALWPFALVSLILALLLATQVAHYHRGELTRKIPAAQGVFEAFGVDIPLPREADRISIDASELRPVTTGDNPDPMAHGGRLQLIATLKNQASYPQAWPHLEIALTDSYDAVLTRRVFSPGEYLPADAPAAFDPGETAITLDLNVGEQNPTGYHMALLYP
jgi:hypothetical protein